MLWREAVLAALDRFSTRRGAHLVERQHFIQEELDRIISDTASQGQTPSQPLSTVLQDSVPS